MLYVKIMDLMLHAKHLWTYSHEIDFKMRTAQKNFLYQLPHSRDNIIFS